MELRPYQSDCIAAVHEGFKEFDTQLVVCPTGGGKTIIFSHVAKDTLPGKTLILAHREELITQACEKLSRSVCLYAEVEKAEQRASLRSPVVVGSVQTLLRRLDRWPRDHFAKIIADEAHHSISDSWQTVLRHFNAKVLGVTATPDRGDKRNLGQFYQNIAYEISLLDLIAQGYLSPIKVKALPLEIDLSRVRTEHGDFKDSDLGDALAPYLRSIARALKEHASGRKTLVFVPLIATSRAFVEICNEEGLSAAHVDGQSPDRAEVLARFSRGEFQLLSNAMLLTEGYDEPSIDCVVVLRPTRSRSLFSQMVGRGTRLAPGKADMLLLDFLWLHERHALIRPAHLIASSDEMADAMIELTEKSARGGGEPMLFDLTSLETEARGQREEKLREELEKLRKRQSKFIDAMELALELHDVDLADWQPTMGWHEKTISPGQVAMLEKNGVDAETVRGRGHASAIIDKIIQRREMGLATPKQVHWLRKLGHHAPEAATFEQASAFLDFRFNRNKQAA